MTNQRYRASALAGGLLAVLCSFHFVAPAAAEQLYATPNHALLENPHGARVDIDFQAMREREHTKSLVTTQDDYDVSKYEIVLLPDFPSEALSGIVNVYYTVQANSMSQLELDLYDNYTVSRVENGSGTLSFSHSNDILTIDFPSPQLQRDESHVTVFYSGIPQPAGFLGMQFDEHAGEPILATLSEPYYARSWWPCKDVPSDKAFVVLSAVVPEGMYCASNGDLISVNDVGFGSLFTWQTRYPISTYLVSIAATNYVGWEDSYVSPSGNKMDLEFQVFPEDLEDAQYDFANVIPMLDFFTEKFGEYPFIAEKYGMAEFVWAGAMEHQTMTSYGDALITGDRFFERLVAHELSHHWWGNLMTLSDWNEIWLHEGFAVFSEALWIEHTQGREAYETFFWNRSFQSAGFPGVLVPPANLFGNTVYWKGGWVLNMLRGVLGDPAFFAALKGYAQGPLRYSNVTIADFIESMETSSGQELDWFFQQWLYRPGRPDYEFSWNNIQNSNGKPNFYSHRPSSGGRELLHADGARDRNFQRDHSQGDLAER